ncbi:tumor necrosis factor receptor superfamily member 10B isoform X2 [Cynocephalus volans]|uniref:tumor necrosis factor receptor superfamily member 10B isoform X2 n=1 Tax=Cynocephalus volans TaxID=110931 RepID=UPI002FC7138C
MGQRRQSALVAPGAGAERVSGPRRARGAGSHWVPKTLMFVVAGVLLPVAADSATIIQQDRVYQQRVAPQSWRSCPPGSHISESSGDCLSCKYGVDYITHWNSLSSCFRCTVCNSDEEEKSPCTTTRDTVCQCKPGTFREADSPEMCQKCSTGCPSGMVEKSPCTPWRDLMCVPKESGNKNSFNWVIVPALLTVVALVVGVTLMRKKIPLYLKSICLGCGGDPKCVDTVFSRCRCPPRGPGAQENAHNEILSSRYSASTLNSELEMEGQEPTKLAGVTVQSLGEAKCLLEPAEAKGSQKSRRLLDPAHDADSVESLRLCFHSFPDILPFTSWNLLMRLVGLTENEIHVARARAADPRDALYEMLVTWVNKTGRGASVNTLLDALEAMGERHARETIEDQLVGSRRFVYRESGAGSAAT